MEEFDGGMLESFDVKERSTNYTGEEVSRLQKLVDKYKEVLLTKRTDATSSHKKESTWLLIEKEFNSIGDCWRSAKQLKLKFENMKRLAKRAASQERQERRRTGGGPPPKLNEDEHYEWMKSVLNVGMEGNEAVYDDDVLEEPAVKDLTPDPFEKYTASQQTLPTPKRAATIAGRKVLSAKIIKPSESSLHGPTLSKEPAVKDLTPDSIEKYTASHQTLPTPKRAATIAGRKVLSAKIIKPSGSSLPKRSAVTAPKFHSEEIFHPSWNSLHTSTLPKTTASTTTSTVDSAGTFQPPRSPLYASTLPKRSATAIAPNFQSEENFGPSGSPLHTSILSKRSATTIAPNFQSEENIRPSESPLHTSILSKRSATATSPNFRSEEIFQPSGSPLRTPTRPQTPEISKSEMDSSFPQGLLRRKMSSPLKVKRKIKKNKVTPEDVQSNFFDLTSAKHEVQQQKASILSALGQSQLDREKKKVLQERELHTQLLQHNQEKHILEMEILRLQKIKLEVEIECLKQKKDGTNSYAN